MFGSSELLVIGLIIFVLFGAAAIPKFAKSIGQAKAEFEKGARASNKETESKNVESKKEKKLS